jgi:hypothetical protein
MTVRELYPCKEKYKNESSGPLRGEMPEVVAASGSRATILPKWPHFSLLPTFVSAARMEFRTSLRMYLWLQRLTQQMKLRHASIAERRKPEISECVPGAKRSEVVRVEVQQPVSVTVGTFVSGATDLWRQVDERHS